MNNRSPMEPPDVDFDEGLPQSIESERTILGAIILDNEVFFDEIGDLSADDFYLESHRTIFKLMADILFGLVEGVVQADIVTISEELGRQKRLSTIGGVAYLASLTEGLPRRLSVDDYVRAVRDKAKLRRLISMFGAAIKRAADQSETAAKIASDVQDQLIDEAAEGEGQAVRIGEVSPTVEKQLHERRKISDERSSVELTWGISGMDTFTKGAFGGEVTVLAGESGGGKLMDVDEMIPTPRGFVRNGDLQEGDPIFGEDGQVYQIIKAHQVVEEDALEVCFDDGTSVLVHAGHLWHTWTFADRQKKFKRSEEFRRKRREKRGSKTTLLREYVPQAVTGSVKTTEEIRRTLSVNNCERANHSIRLTRPIRCAFDPDLPLDPYVLGAWLGDGTSASGDMTIGDQDAKELGDILNDKGFPLRKKKDRYAYTFSHGGKSQKCRDESVQATLRKMRVLSSKHIPEPYFWAAEFQRLELLRGLMDTDGCCNKDGQSEFSNMNRDLAVGVYRLAASLGVKPFWSEGIARTNGKECGTKYTVKWTAKLECFHLRRKGERLPMRLRETQNWRYIIDVRPSGRVKMRCLTTSNPSGLYLFGVNMNVTHNTAAAVQMTLANATEGTPCVWFSLEMPKEKIATRYYPTMSSIITADMMRDPRLINLHTHVPEIERVSQEMTKLPIWIDDTSPLDIKRMVPRIRMMRRKYGIRLVVIDYLQLISNKAAAHKAEQIEGNIFALRELAKVEPTLHILVLSQYSKQANFMKKKRRTKDDLQWGSAIHQAAQNVILITIEDPEKKDKNDLLDVEFRIDKQRDGKVGKVTCMYDRDHLTYVYPQPILNTSSEGY
jgi:replicative DNA helicase